MTLTRELDGMDEVPPDEVVDVHSHLAPPALLASLADRPGPSGLRAERVDEGWRVELPEGSTRLIRPGMFDPGVRTTAATRRGIDRRVTSPWLDLQPGPVTPAVDARSWARRLNESLVDVAERDARGRVLALATVSLDDVDAAADDLRDAVQDLEMCGLVLSTDPLRSDGLDDPRLEALWSAAEELDVPIVLHPASDGPSRALPRSGEFGNALCRLVDTSFGIARLILAGVLDRHPDLKLVAVHGGGFLPYQAMRLDGAHRSDALSRYPLALGEPSAYLSRMWFDTVALAPAVIAFLAATVGADRVLLGSDEPFPLGDPDPVGSVRRSGLDAESTAAVLGLNATGLLSPQEGRVRA